MFVCGCTNGKRNEYCTESYETSNFTLSVSLLYSMTYFLGPISCLGPEWNNGSYRTRGVSHRPASRSVTIKEKSRAIKVYLEIVHARTCVVVVVVYLHVVAVSRRSVVFRRCQLDPRKLQTGISICCQSWPTCLQLSTTDLHSSVCDSICFFVILLLQKPATTHCNMRPG